MTAFADCRSVESRSVEILLKWSEGRICDPGRLVLNDKGRLAKQFQCEFGDAFVNYQGVLYSIEFKSEESNRHDNFFLETYSNRERGTVGWLWKLDADFLFYHFLEQDEVYIFRFERLKRWAEKHIDRFPLREQKKREQKNDTWGRTVPIRVLMSDVGGQLRRPLRELGELSE